MDPIGMDKIRTSNFEQQCLNEDNKYRDEKFLGSNVFVIETTS